MPDYVRVINFLIIILLFLNNNKYNVTDHKHKITINRQTWRKTDRKTDRHADI